MGGRNLIVWAVATTVLTAGCSPSGYDKGINEATEAVAAGVLKLKEYPPLPSPPGHGEYVKLLQQRCGVGYEVSSLPPGVPEADFIQEVRGWNEVIEAEVKRKHGAGIFEELNEEARKRWEEQVNPNASGNAKPIAAADRAA